MRNFQKLEEKLLCKEHGMIQACGYSYVLALWTSAAQGKHDPVQICHLKIA